MRIETHEGQRTLYPDDGKWLYNADEGAISDKVYLGKEANASAWVDITSAKKEEIETQQKEAVDNGI